MGVKSRNQLNTQMIREEKLEYQNQYRKSINHTGYRVAPIRSLRATIELIDEIINLIQN
jgi:hypothetical protein